MSDIFRLPDNIISKEDHEKLESFGGHTIAHGRATRWHWSKDDSGNDRFEVFVGGDSEKLAAFIQRDREHHVFAARDANDELIGSGDMEHVLSELDEYFRQLHGEDNDSSA